MPQIVCILVAVTTVLAGPLVSQETPKLTAFAPLLANPQPYLGQTIALYGVIEQTEGVNAGFKLFESKSSGPEKGVASFLRATWINGTRVVSLQNGQEAVVVGQVQIQDKVPILQVANVITDKEAILQFFRPSERRPRPGDNLGHDAQPSKSISD